MADIQELNIEGAVELGVLRDGPPPVSLSDVGIEETIELNIAPSRGHFPSRHI